MISDSDLLFGPPCNWFRMHEKWILGLEYRGRTTSS